MSDTFYNKMAGVQLKLLTKFGQNVTFSRESGATLDPIAGKSGGSASTSSPKGILTDYKNDMIDGTLIKQGDRLLVLDNSFEPVQGDVPTIGGEGWEIISVKVIKPANVVVGYFCQVRR